MTSRSDALQTSSLSLPRLAQLRRSKVGAVAARAPERLLIVGNGMVGQRFCETLVRLGGHHRFRVVVLGEECTPAYDRVHLTDIWHGKHPRELVLRDAGWYAEHGVELRLGQRALSVDTERQLVTTEQGDTLAYDRLVFATGSYAPSLKLKLDPDVQLLGYRTLEDAERILAKVEESGSRRVVVVGAGLLGLEAARALQRLGCDVSVVEVSSQVLPRQLDAAAADVLERILIGAGLALRTRCRLVGIVREGMELSVRFEEGEPIVARVVVAAVGARASDAIAREAGLVCELQGGIRVDDRMRTSHPRVFAIGECAHHPRVPHGLVAPGYEMADVLARTLLGERARLTPGQAVTRLKLDLTEVTVLGNPLAPVGSDLVWQAGDVYRRLVVSNRRIVAAICIGAWQDLPALQRLVTQKGRVAHKTLQGFRETGNLGLDERASSIRTWADTAVVCNCANVTCGVLRQAVVLGNTDVKALGRATSAGTLCGSCQPQLAELCGDEPVSLPSYAAAARALVALSAVALVAAVVTLVVPRLPIARSVRDAGLDVLWIDGLYKQVSGFVLLALIAIGLTLSLRKRIKRFSFGNFPGWRVLHASMGLAALVVAFAHTGFRLGYNINLFLMLTFLVSALTGAVSGATLAKLNTAAIGSGFLSALRAIRVFHDWVFWPLLVLVGFHVLKVYYF